jgi:predicted O-linked N-acetylglucosamine transferase (SPINDLY family)
MAVAQAGPAGKARHGVARAPQRHPQAESDYRRGVEHSKRERWREAEQAFARATERNPDDAVFWLNLAHARVRLGRPEAAVEAARHALAIDPQSELGTSIAVQCLATGNRHDEIIELLGRRDLAAIRDPETHLALGDALAARHRHRDAVGAYLGALQRRPDFLVAHVHLANSLDRLHMNVEARECLQTAIALGGRRSGLLAAMAYNAQFACRWDLLSRDLAELAPELDNRPLHAAPFELLTLPTTRGQQRAAGLTYWEVRCAGVSPMPRPAPRDPQSRIRIGYVTNDIFRHATAYLIADLLESHDRSRFDVFVYSYGHDDRSPIRARIIAAAGERFVEARDMSDALLAQRVRADDIDILIDLKGYTQGTRLPVFAWHPARIQVNFLGYPGTTGAPCYEYVIGDPIVTPLEHAADYSEKIAQMPHCYQPNDRRRPIGPRPARAQCGLPEDGFVFCCFNNPYKITAPVFDQWCRLLDRVPGSVLWLYEATGQARRNLVREAQQRGIAPERIVWAPHRDLAEHLGRLQLADLVLDTFPVTAHTTASDALWAGVPIVTRGGESFISRVAGSLLHAADLPELVAADADGYGRLALELASDPGRLGEIRARLAANRDRCPLFDSQAYTRDLEALFTRMIVAWDGGEAPQHLPA